MILFSVDSDNVSSSLVIRSTISETSANRFSFLCTIYNAK